MKSVKEIAKQTGVSVRTLHHYDAIGLLKPTYVAESGYRYYDEAALERLYLILLFRELEFSLKDIGEILDAPDYDRNRVLEQQIELLQEKVQKLQNRITFAKGMLLLGVDYMDFGKFDPKKMDDYAQQAKVLYGKTDAYKEYEQKAKGRTKQQEQDLGEQVMALFVALGQLRKLPLPLPVLVAAGAVMVTGGELLTGLLVNRDFAVWDYRGMPLNFHGQICAGYSLLWMPVSLAGMMLYDRLERKL